MNPEEQVRTPVLAHLGSIAHRRALSSLPSRGHAAAILTTWPPPDPIGLPPRDRLGSMGSVARVQAQGQFLLAAQRQGFPVSTSCSTAFPSVESATPRTGRVFSSSSFVS